MTFRYKPTLFLIALVLMTTLLSGCGYNQIQVMDEEIDNKWAQVENQLQRRSDLIPNLVETVKGYTSHESEVLSNIAEARAQLNGALKQNDMGKLEQAEGQFNSALSRLLVVVENYPNLKADQQFVRLQDELAGTENRIAVARMDYNNTVRDYNSYIRQFPQVLTAKVLSAEKREYYNPPETSQQPVKVDFTPNDNP